MSSNSPRLPFGKGNLFKSNLFKKPFKTFFCVFPVGSSRLTKKWFVVLFGK